MIPNRIEGDSYNSKYQGHYFLLKINEYLNFDKFLVNANNGNGCYCSKRFRVTFSCVIFVIS